MEFLSSLLRKSGQTETLLTGHPIPSRQQGIAPQWLNILRRFASHAKWDGGSRTQDEEKVHLWLYSIAQADRNIVFEYVRSTERGLSFVEADRRIKENGPNAPLENSFHSWWQIMWSAFFHPLNIMLIVVSALSYFASDSLNGCIMLTLVFVSVALRFYHEYSSSAAAMKLSKFVRCPIKVQRCAGRVVQTELVVQIDQREVVPGDIIIFEPGDLFPGDVRLLSSKHLVVSQASLTGESDTTDKSADVEEDISTPLLELKNICFKGTNVVSGSGKGLVVSTGTKTYMNTMFATVGKSKPRDRFEKGTQFLSYALIGFMMAVMTVLTIIDSFKTKSWSRGTLFGMTVGCALTPNMLPLIINTCLAKGALAMAKDRCIVKSSAAIRHMGSMDVICLDKTGTLTMNKVILVTHVDACGASKEKVLYFAFINSYFKTDQKYPLDDAILAFAYTNGYRFRPSNWVKLDEIPFDFIRRKVSVILESTAERIVVTKGALEEVLRVCSFVDQENGAGASVLTEQDYQRIINIGEDFSNQGLRVIAVATKKLTDEIERAMPVESGLVFIGLVTFYDPPKDSAKQALWRLAEKGVKAKVLTGDSLSLATRICEELGIRTNHVTTGPELELMDQTGFHQTVNAATVLARLSPTQKLRVVQSLQRVGDHVVGFLGDGVNDSLAIDAANVGISVDSGASVAKDLADIILLEKDLNVLVAGVEHGRITFGNTMKYIKMSIVANVGAAMSLMLATILLSFEPLGPKQLLTQNLMYSISQIAIPWDKLEAHYMKSPRRWSEKGFLIFILWNGPVSMLCDLGNLAFLCYYYGESPDSEQLFQSSWFVEGILIQALSYHMIRTEKIPFIQEIASWPVLAATVAVSAVGIALPCTSIGKGMGLQCLPLTFYGFVVLLFVVYLSVGQIVKKIYIYKYSEWL